MIGFRQPPPRTRTLLLLGLASGFLAATLGIGGGNVTVPALASFLGVPLKRAIGSSLVAIVFVAATAVLLETATEPGNLLWVEAAVLALGSLAGAPCGAAILRRIPDRPLVLLFCALLLLGAARMLGLLDFGARGDGGEIGGFLLLGAGFAAGLSASLFGIGGGIVVVPALVVAAGAPFHAARATSLAAIVPTTLAAAISHARLRTIDGALVRALLPGGILGAAAGVLVVQRLPAREMRAAFALFLLFVVARLARSTVKSAR